MRELAVYYCPKCGYYAYFQLVKNAVCPRCALKMKLLNMRYQNFMDLDLEERDELLARKMIGSNPSIVKRLSVPHKCANNREIIALLTRQIQELEEENNKLTNTVAWMHETIWDLLKKNRSTEIQSPKDS